MEAKQALIRELTMEAQYIGEGNYSEAILFTVHIIRANLGVQRPYNTLHRMYLEEWKAILFPTKDNPHASRVQLSAYAMALDKLHTLIYGSEE